MALKSVVTDVFFEAFIPILQHLEQEKGYLQFVMLSTSLLNAGTWNLTVAAPWIDVISPLRAGSDVKGFIKSHLGERSQKLDSVLIRRTTDRLVSTFTTTLRVLEFGTIYSISGAELEDFHLDEAVCLLARPAATERQALSA